MQIINAMGISFLIAVIMILLFLAVESDEVHIYENGIERVDDWGPHFVYWKEITKVKVKSDFGIPSFFIDHHQRTTIPIRDGLLESIKKALEGDLNTYRLFERALYAKEYQSNKVLHLTWHACRSVLE